MSYNKITELHFTNFKQLQIFLFLINNRKGLIRNTICKTLNYPRTTTYDNINYLYHKGYVNKYIKVDKQKGRPKILWFVPRYINQRFLEVNIPKIYMKDICLNESIKNQYK